MNLTKNQVIVIGALVVFGPAVVVGLVTAHFGGWFPGILAGIAMFLVVLIIAQAEIKRRLKAMQEKQEAQDAIVRRLQELDNGRDNDGAE